MAISVLSYYIAAPIIKATTLIAHIRCIQRVDMLVTCPWLTFSEIIGMNIPA